MKAVLRTIVVLAAVSGATSATAETAVVGPAEVIDGETLRIGTATFRLHGIDAPDPAQTCEIRGRIYNCGRVSATALMDLVVAVPVRCVKRRDAPAGSDPILANCFADGYDLSEGMVHTGWALAMPRDGTKYARIEAKAREARRGLWKGKFTMPWEWRP
jgi:endonuclease YncB( thermonuclease family)